MSILIHLKPRRIFPTAVVIVVLSLFIFQIAYASRTYNYTDSTVSLQGVTSLREVNGSDQYRHWGYTAGQSVGGNLSYIRAVVNSYDIGAGGFPCNVDGIGDTLNQYAASVSVYSEWASTNTCSGNINDPHSYHGETVHSFANFQVTTFHID